MEGKAATFYALNDFRGLTKENIKRIIFERRVNGNTKKNFLRLLKHPLTNSLIVAFATIGAAVILYKPIKGINPKPDDSMCAIVYFEDERDSREIAESTRVFLEDFYTGPIKKFRLIEKDSFWYAKYYTKEAVINKCIELNYNENKNAYLVDGTPDPASIYHHIKKAIFIKDSSGRGIRVDSLPLSIDEFLWRVEDVRTRWDIEVEAGLEGYGVVVVSPPCSWWKIDTFLMRKALIAVYHRNYEYGYNLAEIGRLDSAYLFFEKAQSLATQNNLTMAEVNTAKAFQTHGAYLLWNENKCEEARIRLLIADSIFKDYINRCDGIPSVYRLHFGHLNANKRKFREICGKKLTD